MSESTVAPLDVDAASLRVRVSAGTPVDVLIDGHRVWTVRPEADKVDSSGRAVLPWPKALAERLRGSADVEARLAGTGQVLGTAHVRFDDARLGPDLYDEHGAPMSLTKYGRLRASFDALGDETLQTYLNQAQKVIRALRKECGREAFLDYGTLLGAVRSGSFIGHDLDLDIGYVAEADNPADAMRELFAVERTLRRTRRWRIVRKDGGLLQVFFPQKDGRRRNIDIFSCFVMDSHIYQVHDTEAPGTRADLLPLSTVTLEGRRMPAPNKPELLLESLYGPSWRVPDPSFSYDSGPAQRKLAGWFVGPRAERDLWAQFYARRGDQVPTQPSAFASWVEQQTSATRVIDVGCGNGRDALYFARAGRSVLGLDAVPGVLNSPRRQAEAEGLDARFTRLNLDSLRESLAHGAVEARNHRGATAVYGRFLLHSLTPDSAENFWRFTAMALSGGGRCYLEFRTLQDAGRRKHFAARKHWYREPQAVAEAARRHGGTVVHQHAGTGLAPFFDEDPHVCRMVVEW